MPKPVDPAPPPLVMRPMAGGYQIIRLAADAPLPPGLVETRGFVSITRTGDELSIVCKEGRDIAGGKCSPGWAGFVVDGPLDFGLVGILARISAALADAGVSLFALSTFDTDYVFVRQSQLAAARKALAAFLAPV